MSSSTEEKVVKIIADGKQAEASINQITKAVSALNRERNKEKAGSDRYKQLTTDLAHMNGKLTQARNEVKALGTASEKMGLTWKGVLGGTIVGGIVTKMISGMKQMASFVYDVTVKFQRYNTVLSNALGSTKAAADAMRDIQQFAAKTPYTLDQVTDSYIKLVNRGFKPTMAEMTKIGDLASALGKDFDQLVEAILDAQTGEFIRLREFGILAQKHGDKVMFTFKGVKTEVAFTDKAVQDYIMSLGQLNGIQGVMGAQMETLGGKSSNLSDKFTMMAQKIGNFLAPAIAKVIDFASAAIDMVTGVKSATEAFEEQITSLKNLQAGMNMNLEVLKKDNLSHEDRKRLIQDINKEYGEYLPRLITEKDSLEDITDIQEKSNELFLQKILYMQYEEKLTKLIQTQAKLEENRYKTQLLLAGMKGNTANSMDDPTANYTPQQANEAAKKLFELNDQIRKNKKEAEDLKRFYDGLLGSMGEGLKKLLPAEKSSGGSGKKSGTSSGTKLGTNEVESPGQNALKKMAYDLGTKEEIGLIEQREDLLGQARKKAEAKTEDELKQMRKDAMVQTYQLTWQLMQSESTRRFNALVSQNEKSRETELNMAGLTEQQKAAINEKYDAKRKKLLNEQATAEKRMALFKIAIETAVAAIKALQVDPTGVLSAWVVAQGAVEAGIVASQSVPQMKKGGVTGAEDGKTYYPENVVDISRGGVQSRTSLALIAEDNKPELVVPNWLYSDPRMASTMGALQNMIQSGSTRQMEGGGLTTGGSSKQSDNSQLMAMIAMNTQTIKNLNERLEKGIYAETKFVQNEYDKFKNREQAAKDISKL